MTLSQVSRIVNNTQLTVGYEIEAVNKGINIDAGWNLQTSAVAAPTTQQRVHAWVRLLLAISGNRLSGYLFQF